MKIIVPGNLLLFGEYAITLSGGIGLAAATDTSLVIEIRPASEFILTGTFEDETYRFTKGQSYPNSLIKHILSELNHYPNLHIHIDSSAFCYQDGTKKGLGSSAAATVGLTFALLQDQLKREPKLIEELFPVALRIHRTFQGGKGSGYDILTSIMGGMGVFESGTLPSWTPIDPQPYNGVSLIRGKGSCNTKNALLKLSQIDSLLLQKFVRVSNKVVKLGTQSPHTFVHARRLNHWINHQLGIPIQWINTDIKALGAGFELGATLSGTGEPLKISTKGVRCH